jgi:predicted CoA-binding protein
MKAIFLLSSLFYLLGLKIGHKIDVFRNYNPIEKITTTKQVIKEAVKPVYFQDEVQQKSKADSTRSGQITEKKEVNTNHF